MRENRNGEEMRITQKLPASGTSNIVCFSVLFLVKETREPYLYVLSFIEIRDGNPSNFRFGFLQKSVLKTPDFSQIVDSWNFSGLRILANF